MTRHQFAAAPGSFRTPRNPALILVERRKDPEVNALGVGESTTLSRLDPIRRRLFDAQIEAYRAAVELVKFTDPDHAGGLTLDVIERWTAARLAWREAQRACRR